MARLGAAVNADGLLEIDSESMDSDSDIAFVVVSLFLAVCWSLCNSCVHAVCILIPDTLKCVLVYYFYSEAHVV